MEPLLPQIQKLFLSNSISKETELLVSLFYLERSQNSESGFPRELDTP